MRIPGVSHDRLKDYVRQHNRTKRLKGLKKLFHYFGVPEQLYKEGKMPKYHGRPGRHHGMQPGNPNRKRKLANKSRRRNRGTLRR